MKFPKPLNLGDKVILLSTARKIDTTDLKTATQILQNWGLQVNLSEHIAKSYHQFCGTDAERLEDLQNAINDQECKAIICFRGGYGTVRILEGLDLSPIITSPKWICGYSDVTALHLMLHKNQLASAHTTMPVNFSTNTEESLNSFKNILFGNENKYVIPTHKLNIRGEASGILIGGNLSMLYSLSGTKYDVDTTNKILFLEDLDEYLYHIDRMMWNLRLGNKLTCIKGLIVGAMTDMNDNTIPFGKNAKEIIYEHVISLGIPVCFDFPAGHIDDNRTLVFGKECHLKVGNESVYFKQ